jgi:hypothetical protein
MKKSYLKVFKERLNELKLELKENKKYIVKEVELNIEENRHIINTIANKYSCSMNNLRMSTESKRLFNQEKEKIIEKYEEALREQFKLNEKFIKDNRILEHQIKQLNSTISDESDKKTKIVNDLTDKINKINEYRISMNDLKTNIKTLKTQLELKNDEINSFKKEYEKLFYSKDKKINELQNIVNQSLYSYNLGLNNIKIANKLDEDVKTMMKKLNIEKT